MAIAKPFGQASLLGPNHPGALPSALANALEVPAKEVRKYYID